MHCLREIQLQVERIDLSMRETVNFKHNYHIYDRYRQYEN